MSWKTNSRPYLHPVHDASGRAALTEDRLRIIHGSMESLPFSSRQWIQLLEEDEGRQRFVKLLDLKQASVLFGAL